MKIQYLYTVFLLSCLSCKGLKQSIQRTSDTANESMNQVVSQLEDVKDELIPIDSVIRRSLITSINTLNEDENYTQLDSLSAKFTKSLIRNLDSIGLEKLMLYVTDAVKQSLLGAETQSELKLLISSVLSQASTDLDKSINNILNNIDTDRLTRKLLIARNKLLSQGLSDSLSLTVNQVIANLDMDTLRNKLLTELLNKQFKDTIRSMVNTPVDDIKKKTTGLLDTIRQYAGTFLLGVLAVATAIIYLVFKFRRKNYKDISVLLMKEIEKGGDNPEIIALKDRVHRSAVKRKLEKDIQRTLIEENIDN